MAKRKTGKKVDHRPRVGWEYLLAKPLDRTGLGEEEWGQKCAAELTRLGGEGWEACGRVGSDRLLLKRPK